MKEMEYVVKITTNGPVEINDIVQNVSDNVPGVVDVEVTNYRIKPKLKPVKTGA